MEHATPAIRGYLRATPYVAEQNTGGNCTVSSFTEADKKHKQTRVQIQESPGGLSKEMLLQVADLVKASLEDGNLRCAVAFEISDDAKIPRIAVGAMADKLGIRITNCQIGCFKVGKTIHDNHAGKKIDDAIITMLEALRKNNELTCASVFELALELKLPPMAIADVANLRNLKIRRCQLGCF